MGQRIAEALSLSSDLPTVNLKLADSMHHVWEMKRSSAAPAMVSDQATAGTMPSHIHELPFNEIAKAPEEPGLYAWYGSLYAPLADYKRDVDEQGVDRGADRFRSVLARHLLRYELPPFEIAGRGTFGADWRGMLEDRSRSATQSYVLGNSASVASEEDQGFTSSMAIVARDERLRRLLSQVLTAATPHLVAPIYIGVTKDLRSRLLKHANLYLRLKDSTAGDEERLQALRMRVRTSRSDFAHRAVAMDFAPEHLRAITLSVKALCDDGRVTPDQMRDVAGVAEWLLNRSHRPFAGRR